MLQSVLTILDRLRERLGPSGFSDAADDLAPWLTDWLGRVTGKALAKVSPASLVEVRFIIDAAQSAMNPIVPQGGNQIGIAACRERVSPYVYLSWVGGP